MPDSDGDNGRGVDDGRGVGSGRGADDGGDLDAAAEHLYGLVPDDFVPARDEAVARAREQGDRDLARAIARLRRPTRAAWLANLLARQRGEQLDGLLLLAADLASAQRTLDGGSLRALSSQRHRLVAAMAKEAGRLARGAGVPVGDALLRELQGILEAALADPAVATEVRSGRLTRTITYSGFGPGADPGAVAAPARRDSPPEPDRHAPDRAAPEREAPEREAPDREAEERERRERERRERELAAAEREEDTARDQQAVADAARDDAAAEHAAAREQVAALTAELDASRERERAAATRSRSAATAAKDAARAAGAAATRAARARARLDE